MPQDSCPTRQNEAGETPLHFAADSGHTDVVDLLLARGADASLVEDNGQTALQYAAALGYDSVVAVLRAAAAGTQAAAAGAPQSE